MTVFGWLDVKAAWKSENIRYSVKNLFNNVTKKSTKWGFTRNFLQICEICPFSPLLDQLDIPWTSTHFAKLKRGLIFNFATISSPWTSNLPDVQDELWIMPGRNSLALLNVSYITLKLVCFPSFSLTTIHVSDLSKISLYSVYSDFWFALFK